MDSQVLKKRRLPDAPGVYFFLGRSRRVLYIGRATSLRDRVRSYFTPDIAENPLASLRARRGPWIEKMVREARSIDFRKTDSVLEAVLLEADLVKKFQPPYNTDLKDDKSFNCAVITKEEYPAVFVARLKDIDFSLLTVNSQRLKVRRQKMLAACGPFPHGFQLQTAMKIIRRIFPYRDSRCVPHSEQRRPYKQHTDKLENVGMSRACFNRQIGLCPGTCTGEISKIKYAKTIRNLRLFFEGRKTRLLELLEREMKQAARKQEFEKAGELKRQLFALRHIQDIALLRSNAADLRGLNADSRKDFRIEAYDLSHFGGKEIVGAMAVVENGVARPSEYRLFKLRSIKGPHETAGLQEILRRRFNHPEWPFPQLIVADGTEVQKQAAEQVLAEVGQKIHVVAVVKDVRHRPRDIIGLHPDLHPRVSASYLRESALRAHSEAHRFVLKFQRKRRTVA